MIRSLAKAVLLGSFLTFVSLSAAGCQKPTDSSTTVSYDGAVDLSVTPDPIQADTNTSGKTYRVVRGNNQPDDILPYDWHALFSSMVSLNNNATQKDLAINFPVRVTGVTVAVKQATGGIITPPSGTDKEIYEYVPLGASGNSMAKIGDSLTLSFEVWYHLPSLRKESVFTVTYAFVDNDGTAFTVVKDFKVAP